MMQSLGRKGWFVSKDIGIIDTSDVVTDPEAYFASGRVEKIKSVPCCRRRSGFSSGQTPGLNTHRVTPVTDTTYAV